MDTKQYKDVAEMIRDATGDNEVAKELEHNIKQRTIIKQLMAMRAVKGMTQGEVAEKMGCTQSRVSKLERGTDNDLRLSDLRDYLNAIDHNMMLVFVSRNTSLLAQVKWHVSMIKSGLHKLLGLANGDEAINRGVVRAYVETMSDILKMLISTTRKLPSSSAGQDLPHVVDMDFVQEDADDVDCAEVMAASP